MKSFRFRVPLAATVLALAATIAGAQTAAAEQAGSIRETRSLRIGFSDLDLREPRAVAVLYERLQRAARAVCGRPDIRDLARRDDWQRCRTDALDAAVAQVGDARLAALHRGEPLSESLVAETSH